MMSLKGMVILLIFQSAGELGVRVVNLPSSGPVCGMVLLLCWLVWRGHCPEELSATASSILNYLPLLFVPAGVGIMSYFGLLRHDGLAVGAALAISTIVAIVSTAFIAGYVQNRKTLKQSPVKVRQCSRP